MMAENVLETVDQSKKEKFQRKLQDFQEREWTRENFRKNKRELDNTVETVEELLTDIQSQIAWLQGTHEDADESKRDRLTDEFGEANLEKLESKDLGGGFAPTLKQFDRLGQDLEELRQRENEWKAYQYELKDIAAEKLLQIANTYRREFTGSDVAENLHGSLENYVDTKVDKAEQEWENKLQKRVGKLENALQATRQEVKFYRDYLERQSEVQVDALKTLSGRVQQLPELVQASESGFEDLVDADDRVDLSVDGEDSEHSESDETVLEQVNKPTYFLKEKELHEQYEVMADLVENEPVDEMKQEQIAALTDLTRPAIFGGGKLLDRFEEEFDDRLGL